MTDKSHWVRCYERLQQKRLTEAGKAAQRPTELLTEALATLNAVHRALYPDTDARMLYAYQLGEVERVRDAIRQYLMEVDHR